jgi:hypothetical protein
MSRQPCPQAIMTCSNESLALIIWPCTWTEEKRPPASAGRRTLIPERHARRRATSTIGQERDVVVDRSPHVLVTLLPGGLLTVTASDRRMVPAHRAGDSAA